MFFPKIDYPHTPLFDGHPEILPMQEQPLPCSADSYNPAFLEVGNYISPEFHAEVLALIEDLGLEVVGVTRII